MNYVGVDMHNSDMRHEQAATSVLCALDERGPNYGKLELTGMPRAGAQLPPK